MFFVAKATLCIGLVAVVASQAGGESLATNLDGDARAAAASVTRACWASSDCLRVGAGVLAAASGDGVAPPEVHAPRRRAGRSPGPAQTVSDGQRHRDTAEPAALRGRTAARG